MEAGEPEQQLAGRQGLGRGGLDGAGGLAQVRIDDPLGGQPVHLGDEGLDPAPRLGRSRDVFMPERVRPVPEERQQAVVDVFAEVVDRGLA
jgi:hypothetical protein